MFHPQGPTLRELAVQALSSTERGYDLLAPKFDYTPFRTPEEILVPALSHLDRPRSIAAALDMCCGTGAALRHLRPLCRDRVVGIDFSRGMLAIARRVTARRPRRGANRPGLRQRAPHTISTLRSTLRCASARSAIFCPKSRHSLSRKWSKCSDPAAGSFVSPRRCQRCGRHAIGVRAASTELCTYGIACSRHRLSCAASPSRYRSWLLY